MKFLKALGWYILGFIIVPFLDLVTPRGETKHWRYLDNIYGNKSSDGIAGDADYQARVKRFTRIRWTMLRNPINNYLRSLAPNGIVHIIHITHTPRITKVRVVMDDTESYWAWDIHVVGRLHLWLGYAMMDDMRPEFNSQLIEGKHFESRMLIWPLKTKPMNIRGA